MHRYPQAEETRRGDPGPTPCSAEPVEGSAGAVAAVEKSRARPPTLGCQNLVKKKGGRTRLIETTEQAAQTRRRGA